MFVELPTFEALTVTLIVTAIRTILEASPTILGGVVVAAWFQTRATPERVTNIFRGEGIHGVFRTVLVAMTLPVCSIGVLPVLRELRKLGLPTSKLITLGLVAPLLNPISVLYGLTVLSGLQFLLIVAATGILAVLINDVSSRFSVNNEITAEKPPTGLTGGTRIRNLLIASGRTATGWPLLDLMIVVLVSGLATALIPAGTFFEVCDTSNRGGPLIASLLALPQYVGPARGVIQCAAIERVGLSIPTGLATYVSGVGIGAASILLLRRWYGLRRVIAVAVAVFLFVCTATYASIAVLRPSGGAIDETTGLDGLSRPVISTIDQISQAVSASLWFTDSLMLVGTLAFWILVPIGVIVRIANIGYRNDDPETVSIASTGRMSKAVPASQLGAITICGMAIFFYLATYIFLPSPNECLEEMKTIQLDANIALRSGNVSEALSQITAWDSIAAKLPLSAALRWSFPTSAQQQATRGLRLELYNTRAFLRDGDVTSARKKIPDLIRLLSETTETFSGSSS